MSEVISLDDFRKTANELKQPPVEFNDPMENFTPEAKADDLANHLVAGLYKGLNTSEIDPLTVENQEILCAIYSLVGSITDRHFGVFNQLNVTRDIQAEHGEPFMLTDVFVNNKVEKG